MEERHRLRHEERQAGQKSLAAHRCLTRVKPKVPAKNNDLGRYEIRIVAQAMSVLRGVDALHSVTWARNTLAHQQQFGFADWVPFLMDTTGI